MTGPRIPIAPAAPDRNEYDDLLDAQRTTTRSDVQAAGFVASKAPDPARTAKVLSIADRLQLPAPVVDRNLATLQGTVDTTQTDYDRLLDETPALGQWLSNPDNHALARDEIPHLQAVDRGTQLLQSLPVMHEQDLAQAGATGLSELEASAGSLLAAFGRIDSTTAAQHVATANQRAATLRSIAPDYAKEFADVLAQHSGDVDKAEAAFRASAPGRARLAILSILHGISPTLGEAADAAPGPKTVGEVLSLIAAAAARPRGLLYSTVEGLAGSAPALAAGYSGALAGAGVGSVFPGIGTAAGGVAGLAAGTFLGTAPVAIGGEITAELEKRGVDVKDPTSLARAYADPSLMTAIRTAATRRGITQAAINALFATFAGKFTAAAKGAGLAKEVGAAALDTGIQASGMAAADVAGQVAEGKKVSLGTAAQSGVQMLGFALGETALGASIRGRLHPDPIDAAQQATIDAFDALRAEHDAQALGEITTAVQAATSTASVPARLQDLVEIASGGADAKAVFFQSADWDKYWTAQGESPAAKAAEILNDGGRAYDQARATGAPLAIPLGEYVAKVATTQHGAGLLDVARTDPAGMSLGEARDYLQALPATLQELAAEVRGTPAPDPATETAAELRARVTQQLVDAGTTPAVAKLQSTIVTGLVNLARRAGVEPQTLIDKYALTVRKGTETPDGALLQSALDHWDERQMGPKPTLEELRAFQQRAIETLLPKLPKPGALNTPEEIAARDRTGIVPTEAPARKFPATASTVTDFATQKGVGVDDAIAQLRSAGYDVTPAVVKAAGGTVPPAGSSLARMFRLFQEHRGSISFGEHGDVAIDLFQAADRSTFLHEIGHFYAQVLHDLSNNPAAPEAIKADYRTIRDWVGAEGDAPLTREQHEQFAKGFEAYLMEGKAPSPSLRQAFYRFKQWLVQLYGRASALRVDITDDVRGVFDRLLASDEEIRAAQQTVLPLFDDPKAAGMTDEQTSKYSDAIAESRQAAEEELTTRAMKQLQREETSTWKALREPIRAEIETKVNDDPVYKAIALLQKGTKPDGSPLEEGTAAIKLHREAVIATYGEDVYHALPRGVTTTEGGINPNLAAELLGFRNGRELVDAIAHAIPRETLIDRLADQETQARHGERMSDQDFHEMAVAAVHNEQQATLLRKEMEYLVSEHFAAFKGIARDLMKKVPPSGELRRQAERLVGSTPLREIRPDLYEAATTRAAREASEAFHKGDIDGAFAAKSKQLLATEVLRAARNAKESIDGALEEFRDVFQPDKKLAKTRDMNLVNAARSILAAFGLGKAEKGGAEYLAQLEQYDPETFSAIAAQVAEATTAAKDYKTVSFDDFSALRETVHGLWQLSRRAKQMEIDGKLMDRDAVLFELDNRLKEITPATARTGYDRAATKWEKTKRSLMGVRAALRRVEHWVDAMDGGKFDGAFRKYVWQPISDAAAQYRLEKHGALEHYFTLAKTIEGRLGDETIPSPELQYEFTKPELLGALLHTGNDSNLSKFLRGRGWGSVDENGFLERGRWDAFIDRMHREGVITKADWDFTQGVWDLFESLKPAAQAAHEQLYGHYFAEVTKKRFSTPFGEYAGGYAPAKVDPFAAPEAAAHIEAENILRNNAGAMFPSTGRGFTKSRVESYAAPLLMDLRLVPSHIDAVLRFTHLQPKVVDVARLVWDRDFTQSLGAFDPTIAQDMLKPWLERTASQRIDTPGKGEGGRAADNFFRAARKRSGMQILAVNVVNSLQQLTGVSISAVKVPPAALGGALWEYVRRPRELTAAIAEKSDWMKTRSTHQVLEIQKSIDDIMLNPSLVDRSRDWVAEHANVLTAMTQNVVDTVTWRGAYDHAIAVGSGEREAVRIADSAVRETQGTPFPEDISRFETGTPFHRLFSMFTGYFNMQANLVGTELVTASREMGLRKGAGRALAVYTLGFMIPAVLSEALMRVSSGQPLDGDDDGPWDDVAGVFFGSQASTLARMVPVVGPLTEFGVREFLSHRADDRVTTSAAITTIERAVKAPKDVYDAIKERSLKTAQIRDILTALGMLTGFPIAPLSKPIGYLNDLSTGRAVPSGPIDRLRGLTTGQPGQQH